MKYTVNIEKARTMHKWFKIAGTLLPWLLAVFSVSTLVLLGFEDYVSGNIYGNLLGDCSMISSILFFAAFTTFAFLHGHPAVQYIEVIEMKKHNILCINARLFRGKQEIEHIREIFAIISDANGEEKEYVLGLADVAQDKNATEPVLDINKRTVYIA